MLVFICSPGTWSKALKHLSSRGKGQFVQSGPTKQKLICVQGSVWRRRMKSAHSLDGQSTGRYKAARRTDPTCWKPWFHYSYVTGWSSVVSLARSMQVVPNLFFALWCRSGKARPLFLTTGENPRRHDPIPISKSKSPHAQGETKTSQSTCMEHDVLLLVWSPSHSMKAMPNQFPHSATLHYLRKKKRQDT